VAPRAPFSRALQDDRVEPERLEALQQTRLLIDREKLGCVDDALRRLNGRACHAPEATQRTLTGRLTVTGVCPAAVSFTASVAGKGFFAFLTFFA
jgi:hypothetical protein